MFLSVKLYKKNKSITLLLRYTYSWFVVENNLRENILNIKVKDCFNPIPTLKQNKISINATSRPNQGCDSIKKILNLLRYRIKEKVRQNFILFNIPTWTHIKPHIFNTKRVKREILESFLCRDFPIRG